MPFAEAIKENLEIYQPTYLADSILDTDFRKRYDDGVRYLVIDAESTLLEYDGINVSPEVKEKLDDARRIGILGIAIATNKAVKNETTLWQVQKWAMQAGADILLSPIQKKHRKGGPYMVQQAMQFFEASPDQIEVIGDSLADITAANLAGVKSTLVKPMGWSAHPGHRILRPVRAASVITGVISPQTTRPELTWRQKYSDYVYADTANPPAKFEIPIGFETISLVAGFGRAPIELSEERQALLPPPRMQRQRTVITKAKGAVLTPEVVKYLNQNGNDLANDITDFRRRLGYLSAGVELVGLVTKNKKLERLGFYGLAASMALDAIDGPIAKMDDDQSPEARAKGSKNDEETDKKVLALTSTLIAVAHPETRLQWLVIMARDAHRKFIQRPRYKATGHDTQASFSGKLSTSEQTIAVAASFAGIRGFKAFTLHATAAGSKVASALLSPKVWKHRKAKTESARTMRAEHLGS